MCVSFDHHERYVVPISVRAEGAYTGDGRSEWSSRGGGTDRTDRWPHAKYMAIIEKTEKNRRLVFYFFSSSRK